MKFSEIRKQQKDNGKSQRMTKDEKRFLRRELINSYLRRGFLAGKVFSLSSIKSWVRDDEIVFYGQALKVYR